jgi:5'-nucleotidase (lipoprotein e(P4) family)
MHLRMAFVLSVSFIFTNIFGCAATSSQQESLDGNLWLQTSSEFPAAAIGTYAAATAALKRMAAGDRAGVDRMVVVMDVDETVVDNAVCGTQYILHESGACGDQTWDQFLALRNATAIPGAVDFIRASQDLGVRVWFVTNRECLRRVGIPDDCPQEDDTLANLRQLGIEVDDDSIFLRGERTPDRCRRFLSETEHDRWTSSDKTSRRQCVALDREIVMLIGDQLGDFIGGLEDTTPTYRRALVDQHEGNWGNTWFMIPNPVYGSWLDLLQPDKRSHLRGL